MSTILARQMRIASNIGTPPQSRAVGAEPAAAHPAIAVYVRVNPVPTEWFTADIAEGVSPAATGVIVPKLETPEQLSTVASALEDAGLGHLHVLAASSASGVDRVREFLAPPVAVAYFGTEDFVADMDGVRTLGSTEVLYARSRVALAARLAGVPAVDQVVTRLDADDHFLADAAARPATGQALHEPAQVALSHRAFTSSDEEVDRARRLVAAYDEAVAGGHAAIAFERQMIDEPLARHARAVITAGDGS